MQDTILFFSVGIEVSVERKTEVRKIFESISEKYQLKFNTVQRDTRLYVYNISHKGLEFSSTNLLSEEEYMIFVSYTGRDEDIISLAEEIFAFVITYLEEKSGFEILQKNQHRGIAQDIR